MTKEKTNKNIDEIEEWSVCKPWELDENKFYIDCKADEIKTFLRQKLQESYNQGAKDMREASIVALNGKPTAKQIKLLSSIR